MSCCMYFSLVTPSMEVIIVVITCAAVLEAQSGLRPFLCKVLYKHLAVTEVPVKKGIH